MSLPENIQVELTKAMLGTFGYTGKETGLGILTFITKWAEKSHVTLGQIGETLSNKISDKTIHCLTFITVRENDRLIPRICSFQMRMNETTKRMTLESSEQVIVIDHQSLNMQIVQQHPAIVLRAIPSTLPSQMDEQLKKHILNEQADHFLQEILSVNRYGISPKRCNA